MNSSDSFTYENGGTKYSGKSDNDLRYSFKCTEISRKTTKYTYDNNGNQLKQISSYTLPDNTKLRPTTNGTAYGNGVSGDIDKLIEKVSYTYDGFNRLKKAETVKNGVQTIAEYTYNGDDLRESKNRNQLRQAKPNRSN